MNKSPTARISLFLIAALLAGLLPPAARAERVARPVLQNFDISEAAFDPATNAFKCATAAAQQTALKKHPTKSDNRRGFCIRRPAPARRAPSESGFQFMFASFTNAAPPQGLEPVPQTRVRFSLAPQDLGTLDVAEATTNDEGIAVVTFTAGDKRAKGALIVAAGDTSKEFPLEVVGRFPTKTLLLVGLAALVIGVVVVVKGRDPIKPLPPPTIP